VILLPDVNILVAAHRGDHPMHERCRAVLDGPGRAGFAGCAHIWNGFLRLVTHPKVFAAPTPLELALATVSAWRQRLDFRSLPDTPAVWETFATLCRRRHAQGNAVYDLHLAALAMAHGAVLVSSDPGFAQLDGLAWRAPEALAL